MISNLFLWFIGFFLGSSGFDFYFMIQECYGYIVDIPFNFRRWFFNYFKL